ncbi:MAG: alpha/beta hydrolase [Polyangiaceae bacterium]
MTSRPSGIHVESTGEGTPVLLLHSGGMSSRQFKKLAVELAEASFRAVAIDLAGHGLAHEVREPTPLSLYDDVDDVVGLLEELGSAHIVGHSYGGLVGLFAAVRVPANVRSIAVFEPVAFGALDREAYRDAWASLAAVDVPWGDDAAGHDDWLRAFVDYWNRPGAWNLQKEEMRAEFRRVGWAVYSEVRSLMLDRTPPAAYAKLTMPVTLLTGEQSPVAARTVVKVLGETIPNAKVFTIEGAGHMAPLVQRAQVNAIFLRTVTDAEASP